MSILIKKALIYDGTGTLPYKSDILIKNKRIVYLGDSSIYSNVGAARVIEANNKTVIPGLVSIDSDIDHNLGLFSFSAQDELLKSGVTTVIGGTKGLSLAPLSREFLNFLSKNVINFSQININWVFLSDFLNNLKKILKINFGTLIGYTNLSYPKQNLDAWLTRNFVLEKELKSGGAGLSLKVENDLSFRQLTNLAQILTKTEKIFSFHKSSKPFSFFNKILKLSKNRVKIQINHFEPNVKTLSLIEKMSSYSEIHFDFPFQKNETSPEPTETREELENLVIEKTPPSLKFLQGKKLIQFAENQKLSLKTALRKIRTLSRGKIKFSKNKQINLEIFKKVIESNYSIIGQNGLEFLNFVEQSNSGSETSFCSFEKAVYKTTGLPAKKFKIKDRGLIKKNYFADMVIFDKNHPLEISAVLVNGEVVLEKNKTNNIFSGKPLFFR